LQLENSKLENGVKGSGSIVAAPTDGIESHWFAAEDLPASGCFWRRPDGQNPVDAGPSYFIFLKLKLAATMI